MAITWFLDFDDTLATGATTWGLKYALPKLMREHRLTCDTEVYEQAVLDAMQQVNQELDEQWIMDTLFDKLGWPHELQKPLFDDVWTNYRPQLFEDVLPFLQRLQRRGEAIYIISNNPGSPDLAKQLGIADFITAVYTPKLCPNTRPKPDRSLWDYVLEANAHLAGVQPVMVGDDPWSDGAFAERCGLPCWIVDRDDRFSRLSGEQSHYRVRSLLDIPVDMPF